MAQLSILNHLTLPVISSPLFIVSSKELVLAQCKAGIVGSFPALNARGEGEFEAWLTFLTEELDRYNQANPDSPAAPFAVNQIVLKSNTRLQNDMELCTKYKVPIIITSLGAIPEVNEAAHTYGGIVLHDVINQRFAHKAIEKGADGLILVATGAGGHAGTLSPFALTSETREWFDGPIVLAGAINSGSSVLAAQAMGADYAYIGSHFIATKEARADEAYKKMIVDCVADDIVYSDFFTGVHGNYLRPSIIAAGMDPDDLPDGDLKSINKITNAEASVKAWKDVWGCGQGIGSVKDLTPVAESVAKLTREYEAAKASLLQS